MDTDYSLDLNITGMTCLSCSSAIRNLLLKVSEIKDAQVNILTGKVKILLSEIPKAHKVDEILKLITNAGFEAQIIPNHFINYNRTDYKVDDGIIDVTCSKSKFDSIQLTKPNAQMFNEINFNIISIIKLKIVTENEIDNIVERLYNCKGIINIFSYKKWSKMLILYNSKELQLDEIIRKCNLSCGSFVMFSGSFEESYWNCRSQLNLKYTFKIESFEKTLFAKIISKYTKKSKDKLLLNYINSVISSYLYDLFGIYDFTVSEQKTGKDHVSCSNFISFSIFISYNPYFLSGKDLFVYINNILRLNKSEDIYFNDMIVKFIHYTILPSNSINNEYEHLRSKLNKRLWYYFRNFSVSLLISIIVISMSWLNNTDILNTIIRTLSISSIDSLSSMSMVPGIPWNYLFTMFLVTPVVYICGHAFNKKAFQCIISGVPSMEVLISISMNTSFLYSVIMALYIIMVTIYSKYYDYSSINNDISHSELETNQSTEKFPHFLDTACLLTTISLFGKILEIRAKLLVYKILNNTESVSTPQIVNILDLNTMIYESVYKNYFTNFLCSIEKSSYSTEDYMSDINDVFYQNDQLNLNNMIDVQLVELGDIILLSENDIIPYDGINLSVDAVTVNESVITGESRYIEKLYGNSVLAGSKIIQGKIILHVRSIGTESTLGKIEALKRNAKENYVPLPSSIDKLALFFVPSVFLFALCCFIVWFTLAYYDIVDPTYMITLDRIDLRDEYISIFKKFPIGSKIMFGMHFALSVMAISCPCAIGITIPIVTLISTIKALNNDILVQSPHIFDSILKIKSVVFDKTGTLTNGKAQVISCIVNCYLSETIQKIEGFNITEKSNILPQSDIYFIPKKVNHKYPKYTTDTECHQMLWWLIGSAEYNSSHPIGSALRSYAASILLDKNGDKLAKFTQPKWYKYFPGRGIVSIVENVKLILTNNCSTTLFEYPIVKATIKGTDANSDCMVTEKSYANLENWYEFWTNQGATVVYIFIDEGYNEPFCPVDDLYSNKDKLVLIGSVALLDEHMNGAIECINYVKDKISDNIWLCTGDSKCTAEAIALKVGIDIERVMSHALPGDKLCLVEDLKLDPRVAHIMNKVKQSYEEVNNCDNYSLNGNTKRFEAGSYINTSSFKITCDDTAKRVTVKKRSHNPVMMVGDGINDSAGLLAADIGILLGKEGLSDFSSADIVILSNYQYGLLFLLKLARETHKIIRSNLTWALVFNIVAIPLAAGILYPRVVIPPVAASLLMMLSSVIIILSSLSLYFYM
ncbi:E1-E2 ATPase family protein [Cryptosporidium muris RN66]|uniref:E1-E2 ATPase family protein n=1 Tax=Cryptosporidium muris (strain RN66) TaxID=441375 RepID=B6AIU1_CRYMR|nr:E1-E2 ATPase family protein [Cryptosporidium muris RN66]EEA08132.1 E1-E2 ATPase family protein [Cryptosporidium muris RN66]|eukprot:XP_002142481.1 E1-E2 ATPase family protein [Cryptosporidium muris RN66]